MNLLQSLQTITFHRAFVEIGGSINAALLLSNALYWTNRLAPDREGWFYKTRMEWEKETGLSRHEQDKAREQLVARGLLKTRRARINAANSVTALWFRVDLDALVRALEGKTESDQWPETGVCQMPVSGPPMAGNRQSTPYYSSTTHLSSCATVRAREVSDCCPETTAPVKQPIPSDWQPHALTVDLLAGEGLEPAFVAGLVGEFVLYWRATGAVRAVWDAVFVSHARREFAYRQRLEKSIHEPCTVNPPAFANAAHSRENLCRTGAVGAAGRRRETIGERLERYERLINAAEPDSEGLQDAITGDFLRH